MQLTEVSVTTRQVKRFPKRFITNLLSKVCWNWGKFRRALNWSEVNSFTNCCQWFSFLSILEISILNSIAFDFGNAGGAMSDHKPHPQQTSSCLAVSHRGLVPHHTGSGKIGSSVRIKRDSQSR